MRKLLSDGTRIMAVVKADAYGYGAVETSRALVSAGADALAVTRLEEALELRQSGIDAPILVFNSTQPALAQEVVSANLEQTICTIELAQALSRAATEQGMVARVHVKVDTGMGRLGLLPRDVPEFVYEIAQLPGIEIAGTYTHFSTAMEDDLTSSEVQLSRFLELINAMRSVDLPVGLAHAANSAALIRMPDARLDMVRPGTILYGQYPSRWVPKLLDLRDTWQLKTRISFLKKVPAGFPVGYGEEYATMRESMLAVLPIGYADGLTMAPESVIRRQLSLFRRLKRFLLPEQRPMVTIRGRKAPVIGRVAMQMCTLDVTGIPDAKIGDEVTVPARRIATNPRITRLYKE